MRAEGIEPPLTIEQIQDLFVEMQNNNLTPALTVEDLHALLEKARLKLLG